MANELSTRLTLDGSNFNQELDNATTKVEKFQEATSDATKSIQDLGNKGSRSTKELLSEISKISGAERSTSNYRRQLAQMQRDIADLTINYRAMSTEMKNSSIGQETLSKIQELTAKAGEYKDAIIDAQQSISALASDTAMWDGMKMGIDTVSGALQGFVSLGVLGEDSTDKLVKVIAQLKAVEAATNAVIKVGNALQRQSALMTSITTIQTKALTKAKTLETAATGKATIAQKLFNIVAKANPYVLLATALITVVGALAAFTLGSEKAKKKQEEAKEAHDKYMDSIEDSVSKMATAAYSFDTLVSKYKECKTEGEKQQFLTDYKDKINDLGIKVNDINGLENVFINNTENFRRACILRAQAMGLESMQAENYKEVMGDVMAARDLATGKGGQRINEGDPLFDLLKKYNVGQYVSRWGKDYINAPADVEKELEKAIRAAGEKASKAIEDEQKNLQNQVDELNLGDAFTFGSTTTGGSGSGGNGGKNKEIKALEGSKKNIEDLISKTKALRDAQVVGTKEWNAQNDELNKLNDKLNEIIGKEKRLNSKPLELIPSLPAIQGKIEIGLKPKLTPEQLNEAYNKAASRAKELSDFVKIGAIDVSQAQEEIDKLNRGLAGKGLTAKVSLELDQESVEEVSNQFSEFINKLNDIGDAINIVSSINSTYEAFKNLGNSLSEAENGWEAFFNIFQAGMQAFNTFTSILSTINTIMELFNATTATGTALKEADTLATTANTIAKESNSGAAISEAVAEGTVAASKGASSVADIPYVGWALAIAAFGAIIAAVMGAVSSAKGFATGGIVGGNSFTGDKILAHVNSGEMVITQGQQAKLWNFINGDSILGNENNIQFKIRGTDLIGVIENYSKKHNRV